MIIKGTSCYQNAKSGNLVSITGDDKGNKTRIYAKSKTAVKGAKK